VAAVWTGPQCTEASAGQALGEQAAEHTGTLDCQYKQGSPTAAAAAVISLEGGYKKRRGG
jgi:hypothetical protein